MSRVRSSGSKIELALGAAMWRLGLRYRKQYRSAPGKPDFAFVRAKVAVFCDSAFWHGKGWPAGREAFRSNQEFWIAKIERNIARDREVNERLTESGWLVIRFWQDDILSNPDKCAKRVLKIVQKRSHA